jgi:single-strand DNA-binding protein
MFNKVILIGRLGQNAETKTAQNNKEYVILNIATQESWKNDKGAYENGTEWHRVYAWRNLSKFAILEGVLRYREVEDEVNGTTFEHRIAEVHAISMKRLSKVEADDDPSDRRTTSSRSGWMPRHNASSTIKLMECPGSLARRGRSPMADWPEPPEPCPQAPCVFHLRFGLRGES